MSEHSNFIDPLDEFADLTLIRHYMLNLSLSVLLLLASTFWSLCSFNDSLHASTTVMHRMKCPIRTLLEKTTLVTLN